MFIDNPLSPDGFFKAIGFVVFMSLLVTTGLTAVLFLGESPGFFDWVKVIGLAMGSAVFSGLAFMCFFMKHLIKHSPIESVTWLKTSELSEDVKRSLFLRPELNSEMTQKHVEQMIKDGKVIAFDMMKETH